MGQDGLLDALNGRRRRHVKECRHVLDEPRNPVGDLAVEWIRGILRCAGMFVTENGDFGVGIRRAGGGVVGVASD